MATYKEKLTDPRWQKKRLEVFQRDKFTCRHCGSTEKELHVHHLYYKKKTAPQDYPLTAYRTLCIDCHLEEEEKLRLVGSYIMNRFRSMEASAMEIDQFTKDLFFYLSETQESLEDLSVILRTIASEIKNAADNEQL